VSCAGVDMREVYFLLLLRARTPLLFMVRQLHASANLKTLFPKSWLSCVLIILYCLQSNFTHLHSPVHSDQMVWHSCLYGCALCNMVHCSIGNLKAEHHVNIKFYVKMLNNHAETWNVTISLNRKISVSGTSIPQVLAFSRGLLNNTQKDNCTKCE
jgi:hypothetical protein